MTAHHEQILNNTYNLIIEVALCGAPLQSLAGVIADQFMSFGTASDEKLYSFDDLRWMVERQRNELGDLPSQIKRYPKFSTIFSGGHSALIVEEIEITVGEGEERNLMILRLSTVLEYRTDKWMVIHFHASTPDANTQEGEAWPIEEWKRRNKELQKMVAEKTADLIIKNRELEIEAALERVRARAMAMQSSEELKALIGTVFSELTKLDLVLIGAVIIIFDPETNSSRWWMVNSEAPSEPLSFFIKYHEHEPYLRFLHGWKNKNLQWQYDLKGSTKKEWDQFLFSETELALVPEHVRTSMMGSERVLLTSSFNNFGCLNIGTSEPLGQEQHDILLRFAKVFDLTYTRFNDLQKAEAQAREAQIEAALERIRATTMAMHKSDELLKTSLVLFEQFKQLGQHADQLTIGIINESDGVVEIYATVEGHQLPKIFRHPVTEPYVMNKIFNGWKAGKRCLVLEISAKELEAYNRFRNQLVGTEMFTTHVPPNQKRVIYASYFSRGMLAFGDSEQPAAETTDILDRFAKVFEQTYTRFLDLQKAEAQAKEAKIEASLERVRSKAMAMHSSQDLADTIGVFYHELQTFSITPRRCGVGLLNNETREGELFTWNTTEAGESLQLVGRLKMEGHPVLTAVYDHWQSQTEYHPVLRGNEIRDYYKVVRPQMHFPDYTYDEVQYGYFFFFKEGGVYAWTEKEMAEEELQIYRRFTSVLSLTYKRHKDLQHAEAQARKAQIEAAVERVRAKALAMNRSEDILQVVDALKKEVIGLNIPNVVAATIHLKEKDGRHRVWDLNSIEVSEGKLHFPIDVTYRLEDTDPQFFMRRVWSGREKYFVVVQDGGDIKRSVQWLRDNGLNSQAMETEAFVHATSIKNLYHPTVLLDNGRMSLDLLDPPEPEIEGILEKMGAAFDLSYKRFLDLQHAEAQSLQIKQEKERLEETLTNLRATQTQLIQSEKMASLGELTAGIAHEIQNPLNFVNNFSEVNVELFGEMKEELKKGNTTDAFEISEAIEQNLLKISQHGKRADAIVKSMLQHSRKTSGEKEPIDINALVNEYLLLSYHGFRAKDKSFNCKLETDFDTAVGKAHVIGQDIGRVLLNLLNNAFYALSEKKKKLGDEYEPLVIISTLQSKGFVSIRVKDNGFGIPKTVLDKIYQPFFTTKPTGQGTGLGLSLSYDIITKGHGGAMKVETEEGKGTEFILNIPQTQVPDNSMKKPGRN